MNKQDDCKEIKITSINQYKPLFSATDVILAMIGDGWIDIEKLHSNLNNMGICSVMEINKKELDEIISEMELNEEVSVHWCTRRVGRNF